MQFLRSRTEILKFYFSEDFEKFSAAICGSVSQEELEDMMQLQEEKNQHYKTVSTFIKNDVVRSINDNKSLFALTCWVFDQYNKTSTLPSQA